MAKVKPIHTITFLCILSLQLMTVQLKALDASFNVSDSTGCAPLTIYFTNSSTDADSFYWDFNDGLYSNLTNPTHIFYGTGIFKVKLYAYDSLMNVDSSEKTIEIPENKPYFSLPNEACPGQMLSFSVYGNYNADNKTTWDLGNGYMTNNKIFQYSYANSGTYNVILSVDNPSCGVIIDSNEININTNIIPTIHIHPENADSTICPNENFPFFYDELYPISWNFGNGDSSTDPYPTYSYPEEGIYNASITVTNECGNSNSLNLTITVDSLATPDAFSFCSSYISCPGQELTFVGGNGFNNTYIWNFGNGAIDSGITVKYIFSDTGTYDVTLEATNICNNSDSNVLSISIVDTLSPYPWLYIDKHAACPNETINFSGNSNLYFYQLDFGDGNYTNSPITSHSYPDTGVYIIQLSVTNECGVNSILTDTIIISSNTIPQPDFNLDQYSYCLNDQIFFTVNNSNHSASILWEMGDGSTYTTDSIYHTFTDTGNYEICLTLTNSCGNSDSIKKTITIDTNSTSTSLFTAFPSGKICPNTEVSFTNYSSDTLHSKWYFGDGDSSSYANPKHTYNFAGNAFVQLITKNNCNQTSISTETITITNSLKPIISNLNCTPTGDSILFTWDLNLGILGYDVSLDNGTTWINLSNLTNSYTTHVTLLTNFQVRAIGTVNCEYGNVSNLSPCTPSSITDITDKKNILELFPNPAETFLMMRFPKEYNLKTKKYNCLILIVDALGKTIETRNIQLENTIKLDISKYKNGLYYINLFNSEINYSSKFSVIN